MSRLVSLYISCLVSWTFSEQWFDVFHQLNIYKTLFLHILLLPWSLSPFFLVFFSYTDVRQLLLLHKSWMLCCIFVVVVFISFFPVAQFKLISTDLIITFTYSLFSTLSILLPSPCNECFISDVHFFSVTEFLFGSFLEC